MYVERGLFQTSEVLGPVQELVLMKFDKKNRLHRADGTYATILETISYLAGMAKGVVHGRRQGIAIGVTMAARAIGWPVRALWNAITQSSRRKSA